MIFNWLFSPKFPLLTLLYSSGKGHGMTGEYTKTVVSTYQITKKCSSILVHREIKLAVSFFL